jgi:hypothetical protein
MTRQPRYTVQVDGPNGSATIINQTLASALRWQRITQGYEITVTVVKQP